MAPKPFRVCVTTVNNEFNFIMDPKVTGKQLFDQVARIINLRETWFFGLEYTDAKSFSCWLKLEKKILSHNVQKDHAQVLHFRFLARFYPEDVSEELIEEITQSLFFLQVKQLILDDLIYCPPETCVLLASYAMQVKYGDYDENKYPPGSLTNERLLPQRVGNQFQLSSEEWVKRVVNWWKEHEGLMKEEAMIEYLKVAQDLEMFGISYFEIQNQKGTALLLGVDAIGINIYDRRDKLIPKLGFPWIEIRTVLFKDKKFIIQPADNQSPDFVFTTTRISANRQILSFCEKNHELYVRRRNPETTEVAQMKAQAAAEKRARNKERERVRVEIERRKQAEQERESLQQKIDGLERKNSSRRSSQSSTAGSIDEQNHRAKESDDKRRKAEKAQLHLQRAQQEADREHRRASERTRYEKAEREKAILQAKKSYDNGFKEGSEEYAMPADTDSDEDENSTHRFDTMGKGSTHEDMRTTTTTRDQNRTQKLEAERKSLVQRQQQADTREDKISRENTTDKGIDKYKTLQKIREGTVKRRIDEFEAM
ncbi:unnamed protein product [Rotaria socialis]|uniref:FERM domain-containing protein n=1 Tax=Rotaria socialis TaxID=392032 RepID=A0A818E9C1_9BILA|nr:unnamed protein product [Rotaria socialis]